MKRMGIPSVYGIPPGIDGTRLKIGRFFSTERREYHGAEKRVHRIFQLPMPESLSEN
jgi:hypothetical protein